MRLQGCRELVPEIRNQPLCFHMLPGFFKSFDVVLGIMCMVVLHVGLELKRLPMPASLGRRGGRLNERTLTPQYRRRLKEAGDWALGKVVDWAIA